jgi:hypothetical protein
VSNKSNGIINAMIKCNAKKEILNCLLKEKVKRKSLLFIRLLKSGAVFEELIILKQKRPLGN